MSVLSDLAAKEQADFAALNAQLVTIQTGIDNLDAMIVKLQSTPSPISVEDQALLDQMSAASTALVAQANAINVVPPPVAAPVPSVNQPSGSQIQAP